MEWVRRFTCKFCKKRIEVEGQRRDLDKLQEVAQRPFASGDGVVRCEKCAVKKYKESHLSGVTMQNNIINTKIKS